MYIYSFVHTDGNDVYSFTADQPLKKNMDKKTWLSYINPLRGMLYKGGGQGGGDKFSSERIAKDFQTNAFLFTGEKNKFKKVDEIHTEAISTTVPIPFPFGAIVVIYENIRMDCKKNQQNIETIQFKRIKGFTAPQLVLKSNYVYVFKCKTS